MPETEIPAEYRPNGDARDVSPFHALLRRLRDPERGCPWDAKQTFGSMAPSLLGEAEEAAEALASCDAPHICEELGDVLLNVMLSVVIAEEGGLFTWRDVIEGVTLKLVRRHPHVFGGERASTAEEALAMFLEAKSKEKGRSSDAGRND